MRLRQTECSKTSTSVLSARQNEAVFGERGHQSPDCDSNGMANQGIDVPRSPEPHFCPRTLYQALRSGNH